MKRIVFALIVTVTGIVHAEVKPYSVVTDNYCGQTQGAEALEVCLTAPTKTSRSTYLSVAVHGKSKQYAVVNRAAAVLGAVGGLLYEGRIVLPGEGRYDLEHEFHLLVRGKQVTLTLTHQNSKTDVVTESIPVENWRAIMHTL